jgi:hypothetical protein
MKPFEISNHEKQKEKHAAIQFFRSLLRSITTKDTKVHEGKPSTHGWLTANAAIQEGVGG